VPAIPPKAEKLKALGLGAGLVLAVLLAAELASGLVRVPALPYPVGFGAQNPARGEMGQLFVYDPRLFWRQRAHARLTQVGPPGSSYSVSTNSLGLRSPPFRPNAGGTAILSAGDSTTWGEGVEDGQTFSAQLQAGLHERWPQPVQVLNAGVPGYSTVQAGQLLDELLVEHDFDLVIIHDMFADMLLAPRPDEAYLQPPWMTALLDALARSRLFRLLRYQLQARQSSAPIYAPELVPRVPPDRYRHQLEAMVRTAQQDDAEVLLLLPFRVNRDPEVCVWDERDTRASFELLLRALEHSDPAYRQVIREVAASTGAALLDLQPLNQGRGSALYLDMVHPNRLGHLLIAEAIRQAMQALPEGAPSEPAGDMPAESD